MWDLIVSIPDHCLSFYFVSKKKIFFFFFFLQKMKKENELVEQNMIYLFIYLFYFGSVCTIKQLYFF